MGNADKDKTRDDSIINEILDSDEDTVEIVDLAGEGFSDSNELIINATLVNTDKICQTTKSLVNCNISRILDGRMNSPQNRNGETNICASTPNRIPLTVLESPIIIDDSLDNSLLTLPSTNLRKRKLDMPSFIDLCENSDTELESKTKKIKTDTKTKLSDIIVIPDTPKNIKTNNNRSPLRNSRQRRKKGNIRISKTRSKTNLNNNSSVSTTITTKCVVPQESNKFTVLNSCAITNFSNAGYNVYNPSNFFTTNGLRPIIIDGSNVAIQHGIALGTKEFSVAGLEICIDYFKKRNHMVKAFIPHYRLLSKSSSNPQKLQQLEKEGKVICTPSRNVGGRLVVSYDDRYIVQIATEYQGIIVSNDNYRDLQQENPIWKETIEKRLLMFTWVDNVLMFPLDPLGRNGPPLDRFLKF